jgi:hypothetical protein
MQMLQMPEHRAILAKLIRQSQIPPVLFRHDSTATTTNVLRSATTRATPDHSLFFSQDQITLSHSLSHLRVGNLQSWPRESALSGIRFASIVIRNIV